jgi:hypothetical protein
VGPAGVWALDDSAVPTRQGVMISKGRRLHSAVMNAATRPLNSRARDRAVDRIRAWTVGTAVAGFVATGAFGTLAALTYAGQPATTGDSSGTSGSVRSDVTQRSGSSSNISGSSGTGVDSGSANALPFQAIQVPIQPTHHAHVSSGGSGG